MLSRFALFLLLLGLQSSRIAYQNVNQGVYTTAQAQRGQTLYQKECASCHGETLGGLLAPPLTGDDFVAAWSKEPLSELPGKIRNTMPQTAPGRMSAQQTADIVAYILQASKYPAGPAELRADE